MIIPLGVGIFSGLDLPFPNKKLIKKLYNEYPLYITPSNKYFSIREVEIDNSDSLEDYLKEGSLKKFEVSYDEFYELLWTDEKLLETVGRNFYRFEMEQNFQKHHSIFKKDELNLIKPSDRFRELIPLSIFSTIGLFFVFLISFLVEPFMKKVEKKVESIVEKVERKDEPNNEVNKEKEITTVLENDVKSFDIVQESKTKTKLKFINYFSYNNEYLSNSTYLIRFIIGFITIPIFFIGLLLISTTVYKRSYSLRFGKIVSVINSILIPIFFSLSIVINNTQKILGESDDPLINIVYLYFIPHLFLIFKNGKKSL